MPDRDRLRELRAARAGAEAALHGLGALIAGAQQALGAAQRSGDTAGAVAAMADRDALRGRRADLMAEMQALAAAIEAERDDFDADLAERISALAADVPVALLPVRIETRFLPHGDTAPTVLWVRIYPDDIHIDTHEPELSHTEIRAAELYWEAVTEASGDAAAVDAAWGRFAEGFDPNRAEWILRVTRPPGGGESVPGDLPRKDGPWTRAPVARALPDRFVALGYVRGRRVFAQWGTPVADRIPVGPEPDLESDDTVREVGAPPAEQAELAIDDGMRWLVDLAEAERLGMAIRVPLQPEFARGVDRLVVLGVRWSDDPHAADALLEAQLESHRFSEGLAVLRPGAATNNTPAERSADTSARPLLDPLRTRTEAGPGTVGSSTTAALGLDPATLRDVPGAARDDRAGDLHAALWPATLGYYGEQLLLPLLTDRTMDHLRDHFVGYVRGKGPLPSLRIGHQPYGLLPVMARGRLRSGADDISQPLEVFLERIRGFWSHAARTAPRLGRTGDPVQDLVEVLGMSPTTESVEGRPVLGRHLLENLFRHGLDSPVPERSMEAQRVVAEMLLDAVGIRDRTIRMASLSAVDATYPIRRPFVQRGELSESEPPSPDFVRELLGQLGRRDTMRRLRDHPPPTSLLELMLRHAARVALGNVATRLNLTGRGRASRVLMEAEFVDVETRESLTATALRLVDRVVDGVTGGRTVAEVVADDDAGLQDHLTVWHDFRAGLQGLVDVPSAELHRLFADLLDVLSHRLDAWCTSLATRRLETLRATTPAGIHIGAYGFVEDLRPRAPDTVVDDPDGAGLVEMADNAGYVHAPSLAHASTAAILRSGFLAHGGAGDELLAVDLSSARVAAALDVIDGVRQGERLGAVLGYRIERRLRERELGSYIMPLRAVAPLVVDVAGTVDALEAAIAGAVVDGQAVVDLAGKGELFGGGSSPFAADDPNRQAVEGVIAEAADTVDALADLLLAESVHQTVLGDTAGAAAALAAIDHGATPRDPDVARTPRTGLGLTHRVAVIVDPAAGPAPGWTGGDAWPRTVAEPGLDRWVGALLGDPDRLRVQAVFRDDAGAVVGRSRFTVADVGLAALDVVCGLQRGSHGEHSEFEARLRRHAMAVRPAGVAEGALPELSADRDAGVGADEVSLAELLLVAEQIGLVVARARAASAPDLTAPDEAGVAAGVDVPALRQRAEAVEAAFEEAVTRLEHAVEASDPAAVERALHAVAGFGAPNSVPALGAADEDLVAQGSSVLGTLVGLLATLEEMDGPDDASDEDVVAALVARIELVCGGTLRVLPLFLAANPAEAVASRAQSAALQGGDPLRAAGWLAQAAMVREGAERMAQVVLLAETVMGTDPGGELRVLQLPHVDGDRWVALDFSDELAPSASLGLVLHDGAAVDFAAPLAGFVVDEWTEVVPRGSEITGFAFHYDQPDATAPNVILIGVHPGDAERWDLDTLEATVLESMDLAQIRAVDTDELRWLGRFLPLLYFPDNLSGDTAAVDLLTMASREAD